MRTVVLLGVLLFAGPAVAQTPPSPSFVDVVSRSGFIFEGTIKQIGASTSSVPTQPNTAIVVVDRVIEALPPVSNRNGQKVTVRFEDIKHVYPHQTATFFTSLYSMGASLGLDAVSVIAPDTHHKLGQQVQQARQIIADQALSARLASAQAVIVGVISDALPPALPRLSSSEHDPLWRRRAIQVESFEKGTPTPTPIVYVSQTGDRAWARAPKPPAGTRGIFLLQPTAPLLNLTTAGGPFLVDPLDFLPRTDLDRVRRLLRPRP